MPSSNSSFANPVHFAVFPALSHIAYWKSKPQPLSLSVYALTNVGLGALVMYSLSEYTSEIIPASCFENMAKKSFPLTPIFTSPLITSKLLMAVFSVLQTPSKTYFSLAISKPFSAHFSSPFSCIDIL